MTPSPTHTSAGWLVRLGSDLLTPDDADALAVQLHEAAQRARRANAMAGGDGGVSKERLFEANSPLFHSI